MGRQRPLMLALVLACGCLPAAAIGRSPSQRMDPSQASQGGIRFFVQASQYRGIPGSTEVEISYVLPLENLQFLASDTVYQAGYTISALFFDRSGRQAGGDSWERKLSVVDYAAIGRQHQVNADTLRLAMPPGRYRLRVTCADNNSERQGFIEQVVDLQDFFARSPSLGGIRFERKAEEGLVPWARKAYGGDLGPLSLYLRLYADRPDTLLVKVKVEGMDRGGGKLEVRDSVPVEGMAEYRREIVVDSLVPGSYRVEVEAGTLSDPGRPFHRARETVTVRGRGRGGAEASLEVLRYIATRKELRQLEGSGPGERDSLLDEFWKGRDPTPGTVRNEARDDFYLRVEEADRKFSLGVRPGWRTDRGRIYIKYGPPDDVERHPFEPENPSYEIWYYYADGIKFMFMDVHGYGEYRLMNPKAERR